MVPKRVVFIFFLSSMGFFDPRPPPRAYATVGGGVVFGSDPVQYYCSLVVLVSILPVPTPQEMARADFFEAQTAHGQEPLTQ